MKSTKPSNFILSKLKNGYYTFSLEEAERTLGPGENTRQAIYRLVKQGWLLSLSKGFYVIIDPQHQGNGFVPVEWFIDDWMKYLGRTYYIGLLSAGALHGASHQKPQQIQVVVDKTLQTLKKGAYHISFFYKKNIHNDFCERRKSPAGYFSVSPPEMTAYDILRYPKACPSLDLAATVLQELGETIRPDHLAALLDSGAEMSVLQRLGWLLDYSGWADKTGLLANKLQDKQLAWRPMRRDMPDNGSRDVKWHIIANAEIEADL